MTNLGTVVNNIYEYPIIEKKDSKGRIRVWQLKMRLVRNEKKEKINFDVDNKLTLPFKETKNAVVQMWTESGIKDMKITRSSPTYIKKGKNIGKTNETTVFTQALSVGNSKYTFKLGVKNNKMYYPFAVHKYDAKPRDEKKHIRYPVAVQRKLDGVRVVVYKSGVYSRKLKPLQADHIIEELKQVFERKEYSDLYLDGELYKHGLSLQAISGLARRRDESKILQFHIFDLFSPKRSNMTFEERHKLVKEIFSKFPSLKYCVQVETFIADDKKKEDRLYEQFLSENYEGSIVRNLDAVYEYGTSKEIRTYQARKRKPRFSDDYKVVGYSQGTQGKDVGAIIFELETENGIRFNATPVGMTYDERYDLFNKMPEIFDREYKNKLMIVEYDDISLEGVPLRAKAKSTRVD